MTVATDVTYELARADLSNASEARALIDLYMSEMAPYVAAPWQLPVEPDGRRLYPEFEHGAPYLETWLIRHHAAAAGFIMGQQFPEALHVRELFVAAGHRRMGVGSAAVDVLQQKVRRGTYPGLLAMIYSANAPALAFWRLRGFVQVVATMDSPPNPPGLELWAWPPVE